MATLPLIIDPSTGQPTDQYVVGTEMSGDPIWQANNGYLENVNPHYDGEGAAAVAPTEDGSFSALAESWFFDLPPEVAAQLSPGTNPFASLAPNTSAGAPAGSPSTTPTSPQMGAPAPAGSGGLLPGIGGLPSLDAVPQLSQSIIGAYTTFNLGREMLPDWDIMPPGRVYFDDIRNRQITGVRVGVLPMVVFPSSGGSNGEWSDK